MRRRGRGYFRKELTVPKRTAPAFIFMMIILAATAAAQAIKPLKPQAVKPSPAPMPVVTAVLKVASPVTNANGECAAICPATILFTGTIQANMACTVQYRFVRSDSLIGSTVTLNCGGAGSYPVKDEWTISKAYSGGEEIEVLSPVSAKSNKAVFHFKCLPGPLITGAEACGWLLRIDGKNFGPWPGTQDITINGKSVKNTPGYSLDSSDNLPGAISFKYPNDLIPLTNYTIAVTDGGKTISNVYTGQFKYCLEVPTNYFKPGSVFGFSVYQLPPSAGGMGVRLTKQDSSVIHYDLSLVTWKGGPYGMIEAWLPPDIVPGFYFVAIMKGGTSVSYIDEGATVAKIKAGN